MIAIFKQKNPANLLILLIVGVFIKMPMFMKPHQAVLRPADGILFEGIINLFASTAKSNPIFYPLLTFALLFIQAIILNRFINYTADDDQADLPAGAGLFADHFFVAGVELFFGSPALQHYSFVHIVRFVWHI